MLSGIVIENFKAFGWRQEIPIAPLTLIFGPNSAGKSSILQALLLLKQTLDDAETGDALISPRGSLVDLGGFREMVFRHDEARICEITPLIRLGSDPLPDAPTISLLRSALGDPHPTAGIGVRARYEPDRRRVELESMPVYVAGGGKPAFALQPLPFASTYLQALVEDDRIAIDRVRTSLSELLDNLVDDQELPVLHSYEVNSFFIYDMPTLIGQSSSDDVRDHLMGFVTPVAVWAEHPLWQRLYERFIAEDLPTVVERLREFDESDYMQYWLENWNRDELSPEDVTVRNELRKFSRYSREGFLKDTYNATLHRSYLPVHRFLLEEMPRAAETTAIRRLLRGVLPSGRREPSEERMLLAYVLGEREQVSMPDLFDIGLELSSQLRLLLASITYLGPLREHPERHYIHTGTSASEVGTSGRLLPDVLFARPDLVERTNAILQAFEIGYRLEVHPLKDPEGRMDEVFALRLVDTTRNIAVSMRDVGFGISQVLSVIVQSVLAEDRVVLIEQPELHLHPALQAELGDVFIEAALGDRRNTFLIETHSEHLILRVMRRMRETANGTLHRGLPPVHPHDVSILFVQPTDLGSVVRSLELDDEGQLLDPWPGGFFEEGFRERFPEV